MYVAIHTLSKIIYTLIKAITSLRPISVSRLFFKSHYVSNGNFGETAHFLSRYSLPVNLKIDVQKFCVAAIVKKKYRSAFAKPLFDDNP